MKKTLLEMLVDSCPDAEKFTAILDLYGIPPETPRTAARLFSENAALWRLRSELEALGPDTSISCRLAAQIMNRALMNCKALSYLSADDGK